MQLAGQRSGSGVPPLGRPSAGQQQQEGVLPQEPAMDGSLPSLPRSPGEGLAILQSTACMHNMRALQYLEPAAACLAQAREPANCSQQHLRLTQNCIATSKTLCLEVTWNTRSILFASWSSRAGLRLTRQECAGYLA